MNRKLTLMLAAFVAAGYSLTAEAGVVKVTNPTSGNSYVIAEQGWDKTTAKSWLQISSGAVKGAAQQTLASASITEASDLWQYEQVSEGNFKLVQSNAGIGEDELTANNVALRPVANASVFNIQSGVLTNEHSKKLTFSNATNATWSTGTAVDLYAYTKKAASQITGVTLKVGNKYLVVEDAAGTVKLVDESTYQAYLKLGKDNQTLWTVNTDGSYETQYTGLTTSANKYLNVASSGTTLVVTASSSKFETNEAEGLFGIWDGTAATFTFLKENTTGDGLVTSGNTAGTSDIVIVAAAPVQAPPTANATLGSYQLADEVVDSEYYLISSNAGNASNYVLIQENDANPADFVDVSTLNTDEKKKTAYWSVAVSYDDVKKQYKYTFKNKAGVTLKIGGVSEFFSASPYAGGITLKNVAGTKTVTLSTSTPKVDLSASVSGGNDVIGFYYVGTAEFSVKELCQYYNTYFDLNLMDKKNGTSDLKGDLFDGGLVPMELVYNKDTKKFYLKEADENATVFLLKRKADDAYIVLDWDDKWSVSGIDKHVTSGGYKFDKLSKDNLLAYVNNTAVEELQKRSLGFAFSVEYAGYEQADNNKAVKYIKVVDYVKAHSQENDTDVPEVKKDDRPTAAAVKYPVYLTTYESDGTTYLTVNAEKKDVILYAELQEKTLVHGTDKENNPLNWKYVSMKFVNHKAVNYRTEDGRSAKLDGKVLGMTRDNGEKTWEAYPAEASKFLTNKPEGQWVVSMTKAAAATVKDGVKLDADKNEDVEFTFTNRENPKAQYKVARMYSLGNNKFAVEYEDGVDAFSSAYNAGGVGRDTLEITPLNIESQGARLMDGYKNYSNAEIQDTEYRLVMNSTSDVDYYVSENHAGKHLLGISTSEADAVNWRLVRFDRESIKDVDGYVKHATDSIYTVQHPQYLNAADGKYYAYNDTIAIVTYALQNTANGEYLTYEDLQSQDILSMACEPNSENMPFHYYDAAKDKKNSAWLNDAFRFVIKEKNDGLFNILGVSGTDATVDGYTLNLNNKFYGASTKNTVEIETAYTQINSNDLFRLEAVNAPVYRKAAQNDTIRIFREENNSDVMYENGQFLNLGNIDQLTNMAPALYVDTAYINRGTSTRYQYLLVVNPTRKDEIRDNAGHIIHHDTTYGRFLVNMIDSAVWTNANENIHKNEFINDVEAAEPYVKVGFVWGFRTEDNLYLKNGKNGEVVDTIALGNRDFNKAKFAFRYTNPASNDENGSFKIQTRYIDYNKAIEGESEETNNGYLKTINGVVVVVNGYAKGEEFNLAAEKTAPTANEEISANGEVSVVATDGAIVVKGAAGKNVIVSTILGKVVANEVVTSDNATIAAPAGIAVVAVEGESFKVVVK